MKILKIYKTSEQVEVNYKTDLITDTQSNFTVMTIEGLDDAEKALGIDFKQLAYTIEGFIAFAKEHGFGLSSQTLGAAKLPDPVVLVEEATDEEEEGE